MSEMKGVDVCLVRLIEGESDVFVEQNIIKFVFVGQCVHL